MKETDPSRSEEDEEDIDWSLTTWKGSRREQLRRWAELPLERAIMALEEMEELSRSLQAAPSMWQAVREVAVRYGRDAAPSDLPLPGCTPEPLMAYLKALGIMRLVSEQKDMRVRGWWMNDVFWLRSTLDRDTVVRFFLEEYKPTPIVAPWAGGSGFFRIDNKKAVQALSMSSSPRVHLYASVIRTVHAIIQDENVGDKPRDEDKVRLIRRYRRELPDDVVAWMDAAMVLRQDGQSFAPLLGTGGNDGRLDFTQNFMQRIVSLGLYKDDPAEKKSREWLEQALFATPAMLDKASVGQFAPGRAGGPNATQGMEGDSTDNPWDFILMIEGTLLFAGAAVRRFGLANSARPAFPFSAWLIAAGFDSSATKDEAGSRGELWLPLWNRPTSAGELRHLFGEGRAEVSGRPARDGTDFARAVAGLGIDRGIAGFSRLAFLKRSGKAFLAVPLGRFEVVDRSGVDLLREIDHWLRRFRSACSAKDAPPRVVSALRRLDSTVFAFCKYGGAPLFQKIVVALGRTERELTTAERFRDKQKIKPMAALSAAWLAAANDGSPECTVALALASVHDPENNIGPMRANLEAVDLKKHNPAWAEKDRSVAWNAVELATNLASALQRRVMDGGRAGCERLPLESSFAAPLDTIAAFIAGRLNDERIESLLWGLMLVDPRHQEDQKKIVPATPADPPTLPRVYALLKLLFLPRPLVRERIGDKMCWRLARRMNTGRVEPGIVIRPEPRLLTLLRAGRLGEACKIAAHRLRVSGLPPMPEPLLTGVMRDDDWWDRSSDHRSVRRLAAALLIPISSSSVKHLIHLVCRDESTAVEGIAVASEGETSP